jgi:hypothetical protein
MVSGFIIDGVGVHHRWCRGSSSMVSGFIIDGIGLHHRWYRASSSMVSGFIIDGIGVVLERCQSRGTRSLGGRGELLVPSGASVGLMTTPASKMMVSRFEIR